jgi:hypothetical protein
LRVVLAALVGLSIVALAAGNTQQREVDTPGELEQFKPRSVDATVTRVDRELQSQAERADSHFRSSADGASGLDQTRPSPYDVWLDERALAATRRVV